jgi:hypothetical protein
MAVATNRLPGWTLAAPVLALGADLALHGTAALPAGIALGIALLTAVLAAVHHAEVVAGCRPPSISRWVRPWRASG